MRWKGDLSIYTGHPTDAIGAKHLHQYTGTIAEISMQMKGSLRRSPTIPMLATARQSPRCFLKDKEAIIFSIID